MNEVRKDVVSREEQVLVEAELARQLLAAEPTERVRLYGETYDRIYSMSLAREPEVLDFGATPRVIPTLLRYSRPGDLVLEIGCGTGLLAIALCESGREVSAVDVSQVALDRALTRAGSVDRLELRRVDGPRLPFPDGTFRLAYSVEVLEHLHEDDAKVHFAEVARILAQGGRYWFMTPNRLASMGAAARFGVEVEADGDAHLKEWTHHELRRELHAAGFARVMAPIGHSGRRSGYAMPSWLAAALERLPGFVTSKPGYVLGLNQCLICAVKTNR